jgi:hypothetical protein
LSGRTSLLESGLATRIAGPTLSIALSSQRCPDGSGPRPRTIPDHHVEFFIAALTESLELYSALCRLPADAAMPLDLRHMPSLVAA